MPYLVAWLTIDEYIGTLTIASAELHTADQLLINPIPNLQALTAHNPGQIRRCISPCRQIIAALLLSGRLVPPQSSDFFQPLQCISSSRSIKATTACLLLGNQSCMAEIAGTYKTSILTLPLIVVFPFIRSFRRRSNHPALPIQFCRYLKPFINY